MSANGLITFDKVIETRVPLLGQSLQAYVLPNTANALALGRLCAEYGYSFWWCSFRKEPRLWDKHGREIEIYARNYVPYVSNRLNLEENTAMPAPAASSNDALGSDEAIAAEPFVFGGGHSGVQGIAHELDDYTEEDDIFEGEGDMCLKAKANTTEHMMSHKPFNPYCKVCFGHENQKGETFKAG